MCKSTIVEARNSLYERSCWSVNVWIGGVGAEDLAAHLVTVQLDLEGALDIGDCATCANIKIVGPNTDDL